MSGAGRGRGVAPDDPMVGISLVAPPKHSAWAWPVHRTGEPTNPPVIVMHELFGFSPDYTAFCRDLAGRGFCVWMPQIAGEAPSSTVSRKMGAVRAICISGEIDVLRSGRRSPVVNKLRTLVADVSREHGNTQVGVVGMCLSGGFALALAAHPGVVAAVAAQPALPLRLVCGRALGLSEDDLATIGARLSSKHVSILYTRFARDPISPAGRYRELLRRVGEANVEPEFVAADGFGPFAHSVLTMRAREGSPQEARLEQAAEHVATFLRERLTGAPPQTPGSVDDESADEGASA